MEKGAKASSHGLIWGTVVAFA